MIRRISRRKFVAGAAAFSGAGAFPMPAIAQNAAMKVGLLTVKTGPLAAGGIHAEEGLAAFLKDNNFTLSGRKIELVVADTGGNPAGAKNKAQELVERDKVNVVCGPFAGLRASRHFGLSRTGKNADTGLCRRRGRDTTQG